ncbi:MAG: toll/interleukin-1 receptor domain-containing protein [Anaerolineales bacterium]|nr:toll/interleukin-1 receptor domain-containing protein [Anaerolineales bacterium]
MSRVEKTVFISYRRKDVYRALAIYQYLTSHGYDVFFDYTNISSGDFEQIIVANIRARAHFILILTPTALDRCNEPGDWLRREIETAIDERRNIVPLFIEDFSFDLPNVSGKLTGKLSFLKRYNGLFVHDDFFEQAMNRLVDTFLNVRLDAVLNPISTEVQHRVKQEQIAVNKVLKDRDEPVNEIVKLGERKADKLKNEIFISYSRHDVEFANRINNDLLQNKISTWIDSIGIRSGDDWPERIANAILESKIVLAIVSPDALESKWVNRELSFADKNEKLVFPLIYKTCKIPHWFDLRFGNIQWADFSEGNYIEKFEHLIDALNNILI